MTGNNKKNLEQFLAIIREDVDDYCERIKKETDDAVRRELERTGKETEKDVRRLYENEEHYLTEQNNSVLSDKGAAQLKELISHRQKIALAVFDAVRIKIEEFTKTPAYAEFLARSAEAIYSQLGGDIRLYIGARDASYSDMLGKYAKEVVCDESIVLGGLKGESKEKGMTADDTLDMRFEQQKQMFYETSGLSVTL